jgi:2-oxoglutarate dehydrogenase E2 component (dihydrolipoamide succinyltransferase)
MLETEIKKLTEAVIANTAARTGQAVAATQEVPAAPTPAQASPAAAAPVVDVLSEGPAVAPATPAPAAPAAPAAAPTAAVFSKEQVIKAVIKMAKECGREAATTMMATFGAKKASELNDAAQYPAIMTAITQALPTAANDII